MDDILNYMPISTKHKNNGEPIEILKDKNRVFLFKNQVNIYLLSRNVNRVFSIAYAYLIRIYKVSEKLVNL